jgi:TPR repeat protein
LSYGLGEGVPQSDAEALMWFRMAADQGDPEAQYNVGNCYADGKGVPLDYAQAVAWYRKAAEQGDADAQYNLGAMCAAGRGVAQDYVEAHKWRNLAAALTTAENQKRFASVRDSLATKMTPAQLAEAQKRASKWMAAFEKRQKEK